MEMKLLPEILAYYQQAAESTRLQSGPSQLEFARTRADVRMFYESLERWNQSRLFKL